MKNERKDQRVTNNKNRLVRFNYCRWEFHMQQIIYLATEQWTIKHVERRKSSENISTIIQLKMETCKTSRINCVMSFISWVVAGIIFGLVYRSYYVFRSSLPKKKTKKIKLTNKEPKFHSKWKTREWSWWKCIKAKVINF